MSGQDAGAAGSRVPMRRRIFRGLVASAIGLAALLAMGATYQRLGSARDARRFPPRGQFYELGSHRLHYVCAGSGEPTVWLEAGLPRSSLDWTMVQPALAQLTRTCSYDRAGYGFSEPGPRPRDGQRLAAELVALSDAVTPQGRTVLVGHSWGGLVVRQAASLRPDRVAALVLVDPTPAELLAQMPAAARQEWEDSLKAAHFLAMAEGVGLPRIFAAQLAAAFGEKKRLAAYPAAEREELAATVLRTGYFPTTWAEVSVGEATMAQAAAAKLPPELPLRVLVAGRDKAEWERELIASTAGLSRSGQQLVVPESDHEIHSQAPARIIAIVRDIVESMRAPAQLPPAAR